MTPWTVARQAPLSMGFLEATILEWVATHSSRDLPNPEIEFKSSALQADSLPSEPPGKPRILECIAYPFSRGSSQPRNQTGVLCITGGFFTSWATREALWIISKRKRSGAGEDREVKKNNKRKKVGRWIRKTYEFLNGDQGKRKQG